MNTRRNGNGGFTLLELLMVVIIIAILAAIALPQFFRAVERSRTAQVMQLMASIRGSEQRFKAQDPGQVYTKVMTDLDISPLPVLPPGWGVPTVSDAAAGANVLVNRTGGTHNAKNLLVDLDTGAACSDDPAAAADWGVASSAACP